MKRAALNRVVTCPRRRWACIELGEDHPWLEEQQMQRPRQGRHSEGSNSKVSTASDLEGCQQFEAGRVLQPTAENLD